MLKKTKPWLWTFLIVGVGLVGLRLYLPTFVKNYCNRVLDKIPGYYGHIQDVRIHLWRSRYSIVGLELLKTGGQVPVPFFSADQIDFSIHWGALFRGQLVGKLEVDHPTLNFVADPSPQHRQTSIDRSWQRQVKSLFPLRVSRLGIKNGEIHFRNYRAQPPVNIFIHDVHALATNLTNSRMVSKTLKATLDARGIAMKDGQLKVHVEIDPLVDRPTFAMNVRLENLALPELNDFFKQYLAVEVQNGIFDFYAEGQARDGAFKGYAKPLVDHLNFIRIKKDSSIGEMAKALVVKFVSYVMKNHAKDRLATRIEMSGTVDNPDANIWTAISSFLGNWLIHAISPGLDKRPGK